MINFLIILLGKITQGLSRFLGLGYGGTWPGEIALLLSPGILSDLAKYVSRGIVLVAGTNGKTTTSLLIRKILETSGSRVISNESGANLLNGIVSSLITEASWSGQISGDWAVFEIDENSLPQALNFITPKVIVCCNLFRDQLDRYGEVDVIAQKWRKSFMKLGKETTLVLNSDDPQIASLGDGLEAKVAYFGINDRKYFLDKIEHAQDSIFCVKCHHRLIYEGVYYSHIGLWRCSNCQNKRPVPDVYPIKSPLPGLYNKYNVQAAVAVAKCIGIKNSVVKTAIDNFAPAFGRQEEFQIKGKKVKIFLSKNPAGFNESLKTVLDKGADNILMVLNDRIPDGRDVSWIWDVDFEMMLDIDNLIVSGDRAYDLGLRLKYAAKIQQSKVKGQKHKFPFKIIENLKEAIHRALDSTKKKDTLYILPTYSAMLEARKILTGKKIL